MNTPIPLLPGDILLYGQKPWDLFGFITARWTWSPAVHVECYVGDGMSVASRNGIGVNQYPYREKQLIAIVRPELPFNLTNAIAWFSEKYDKTTGKGVQGRPYGWLDLARFRGINIKTDGWICSQFVVKFLRAGGFCPFNPFYPDGSIDPGDYLIFTPTILSWVWASDVVHKFFEE